MIKVLIVDDSAVVRQALKFILDSTIGIKVIGTASNPFVAAEKIKSKIPDVITLDIEMPRMDGLTFLQKIMNQHPIPVIIISSLTNKGAESAMKAMEYGAVEVISKPDMSSKKVVEESKIRISDAVKAAASANLKKVISKSKNIIEPKLSADVILQNVKSKSMIQTTEHVVVVGASTGGTEAIRVFLEALPPDVPGIVIVQHMPEHFTRSFANRLNELCRITVKEAENNDTVIRGRALIAAGNYHLILKRSGARYYVEINDGPLVNRHRPSVDVLFRSAARYAGRNAVGVIMTGMGDDGAKGLLEMKDAGAKTIAQDENSCVVFGMPKEAIKLNAADLVVPLNEIHTHIFSTKKIGNKS